MMDDNLAGYLLDALDPDEVAEVRARLREQPVLQTRLDAMRQALEPLEAGKDESDPPPGLVNATLARIAETRCRQLPSAPQPSARQVGIPFRRWGRRVDWAIAACLLVLVGGLCTPWLTARWRDYQTYACQNNLRVLWTALQNYADRQPDGSFPRVAENGSRAVAGVFVPLLHDAGLITKDTKVSCPAADKPANLVQRSANDLDALYVNNPEGYERLAPLLGGSYAYSLGYTDDGARPLQGLRRSSGDYLPIMADRPPAADDNSNSPNHSGKGQNVLYIGGNVRWAPDRDAGFAGDDIYRNLKKQVHAGERLTDTVLGPSSATPFPRD